MRRHGRQDGGRVPTPIPRRRPEAGHPGGRETDDRVRRVARAPRGERPVRHPGPKRSSQGGRVRHQHQRRPEGSQPGIRRSAQSRMRVTTVHAARRGRRRRAHRHQGRGPDHRTRASGVRTAGRDGLAVASRGVRASAGGI